MKRTYKTLFTLAAFSFALTACSQLQDSLSSEMQKKLDEETGIASIAEKVWYYNGTAGEDLKTNNDYYDHSLRINFGKKVYVNNLSGSIVLSFVDSDGISQTKTFTSLRGKLSSDFTSFNLDMTDVTKHMDGVTIPSGNAVVNLKVAGFQCAEGSQKGRTIGALEVKNIQIRPLFDSYAYDFSTTGFSSLTRINLELKGAVEIEPYTVKGKDSLDNEYEFEVSSEENKIVLSPKFDTAPSDQTVVNLTLTGILSENGGTEFIKDVQIKFVKYLIVLDGVEDNNWELGACAEDAEGDSTAFTWEASTADLTKLSVVNDEEYLYVALSGKLGSNDWDPKYEGFTVFISKDHSFDVSTEDAVKIAGTVGWGRDSLAHGKPDFYMTMIPASGKLSAYVENSGAAEDISESIGASAKTFESADFVEYRIPLSELAKAGITAGDKIYTAATFSIKWDDGTAVADIVPESCVSSVTEDHTSVIFNMKNALEWTIQ